MSENYDGHKEIARSEVSNIDEKGVQNHFNVPVEHYGFQPNNFSIFIPSNVFSNNNSNQISTPINNNMSSLHAPISSTSNIGMNVENLLPSLQFTNFINNIDQPSTSFLLPTDNCHNTTGYSDNFHNSMIPNMQQNPINLSIQNSSVNTASKTNQNNINNFQNLNNKNGSTSITSEDSSFSNPEGWKARSGERDDIPNPRKVVEILRELEKSQQEMNKLRENYLALPNAKRERNRVASRTCRLKKKAVYEINKIKVFHLDAEYKALCNIVKEISNFILSNCSLPSYGSVYTNFYQTIKKKYIPGRMVTGNLEMLIDDVLRNFAAGENIDYYSLANSSKKL